MVCSMTLASTRGTSFSSIFATLNFMFGTWQHNPCKSQTLHAFMTNQEKRALCSSSTSRFSMFATLTSMFGTCQKKSEAVRQHKRVCLSDAKEPKTVVPTCRILQMREP